LTLTYWPAEAVQPGALADPVQAVGKVLRAPVPAGAPILASQLAEGGVDGAWAALLEPGEAAVFVPAAAALKPFGLAYLHLIEGEPGTVMAPWEGAPLLAARMREAFGGPLMLNGGLTRETAEKAIAEGRADLVSVGVPVLANPDLVARWKTNAPLNAPDKATFYGGGAKGYTDYPFLETVEA